MTSTPLDLYSSNSRRYSGSEELADHSRRKQQPRLRAQVVGHLDDLDAQAQVMAGDPKLEVHDPVQHLAQGFRLAAEVAHGVLHADQHVAFFPEGVAVRAAQEGLLRLPPLGLLVDLPGDAFVVGIGPDVAVQVLRQVRQRVAGGKPHHALVLALPKRAPDVAPGRSHGQVMASTFKPLVVAAAVADAVARVAAGNPLRAIKLYDAAGAPAGVLWWSAKINDPAGVFFCIHITGAARPVNSRWRNSR